MFTAITDYGITAQALKKGIYNLYFWNPRDFTKDTHRTLMIALTVVAPVWS